MNHFRFKTVIVFFIVFIYFIFFQLHFSFADVGDLYIDIGESEVEPDKNISASVKLNIGDYKLGSYSFTFIFNKEVIQITNIEGGLHGDVDKGNTEGRILITNYLGLDSGADNILTLSTIFFKVIGDICSSSELTINNATLYDPHSKLIPYQIYNSEIDVVCPHAKLINAPEARVNYRNFTINVTGTGITHYKYSLDGEPYSDEYDTSNPIVLTDILEGEHILKVIGKLQDKWQSENEPTISIWKIYISPPFIKTVYPFNGSDSGGTVVTIQGSDFQENAAVVFGDIEANDIIYSSDQIICKTPEHVSGPVNVSIINPDGKVFTKKHSYSFIPDNALYQFVYSNPSYIKIAPGASFDVNIEYTTSDNNSELSGLGLRIHYDSKKLKWLGLTNVLKDGYKGEDLEPKDDIENYDNDLLTDKRIQISWMDIGRKWTGSNLPERLFAAQFLVLNTPENYENIESMIRFSSSSTSAEHMFYSTPLSLDFQPWTINCTSDGNGIITPCCNVLVHNNSQQPFKFIAAGHHHVQDVIIDGSSVGNIDSYTFTNVDRDHKVEVYYVIDKVKLSVSKGGSGSGTVKPNIGTYYYDYGTGISLSATPSDSSIFDGWSGDISFGFPNTIVIMDSDKDVQANFSIKTFSITPTYTENGHIEPVDAINVEYNGDALFKIVPDRCYVVEDVIINGESRGPRISHSFMGVTMDQTIHASFIPKDKDKDNLPDCIETLTGCTNVDVQDSDNDGILDGDEDINKNGIVDENETNPCLFDTDSDQMSDGWELAHKLNPVVNDSNDDFDHDGYSNIQEWTNNTSPDIIDPPYADGYNKDTDSNQPYQIISAIPVRLNTVAGGILHLELNYLNSLDNNFTSGIGFRIHFSSSYLAWKKIDNIFDYKITTNDFLVENDIDNFDNNIDTDKYIEITWKDELAKWPGTQTPLKLFSVYFNVDSNLSEGDTSTIAFSSSHKDDNYNFYAKPIEFEIHKGNLDIDGNGIDDALTDGLLIMSYLFGYRNDLLIDKAIGLYATRTTAQEIESVLKAMLNQNIFDIDGNGGVNALADGLLIVRYLFGFRDYELIYNINLRDCTRCSADEIEAYIQEIKPSIED